MNAGTLISVEEYLHTSYDPDVEYVDGVLVERNVGKWLHSLIQRNIILALGRDYPDVLAVPELRMQIGERRYRVPDICIVLAAPAAEILTEAPWVVIEILSETDTLSDVLEKLKEYAAFGVPHIWLFDPRLRLMFTYGRDTLKTETEGRLETVDPRIELKAEDVFRGVAPRG
jgi:Uma2 family endonuclease